MNQRCPLAVALTSPLSRGICILELRSLEARLTMKQTESVMPDEVVTA
ncbi:hypothetical protein ACFL0N_01090 [Pseudomonadota bacterium]